MINRGIWDMGTTSLRLSAKFPTRSCFFDGYISVLLANTNSMDKSSDAYQYLPLNCGKMPLFNTILMVIWLFNFAISNCGIKHILIYHSSTNIYHISNLSMSEKIWINPLTQRPRRSALPNKGSGSLRGCVSGTWRVTTRWHQAVIYWD